MKKIFLYVFLILMFCDIAYATPMEALVQSIFMTILAIASLTFFKFEINPFIPFGVIYGFFIIFHAYSIIDFIKSSSKREKKDKWDFTELIFFYAPPILVLSFLYFTYIAE